MKLNIFSLIIAVFSIGTSSLMYPIFPALKSFIHIETYSDGESDFDLVFDGHDDRVEPRQEDALIKAFKQQENGVTVCVEDIVAYVGDKKIQNSLKPTTLANVQKSKGYLFGLVSRLKKAGITAESVDCRLGLHLAENPHGATNDGASNKEIIKDFKNIAQNLHVAHPQDCADVMTNGLIQQSLTRDEAYLRNLENSDPGKQHPLTDRPGAEMVDVAAFQKLLGKDKTSCKKNVRQVFIGGVSHCAAISLIAQYRGFKRIKSLGPITRKAIPETYAPYLPEINHEYVILPPVTPSSPPTESLSSEQIEEYFGNPSKTRPHQSHQ